MNVFPADILVLIAEAVENHQEWDSSEIMDNGFLWVGHSEARRREDLNRLLRDAGCTQVSFSEFSTFMRVIHSFPFMRVIHSFPFMLVIHSFPFMRVIHSFPFMLVIHSFPGIHMQCRIPCKLVIL